MARREVIRHVLAGRPDEAERAARKARQTGSNPHAEARATMQAYVAKQVEVQPVRSANTKPVLEPEQKRQRALERWQQRALDHWDRYLMDDAPEGSLDIPDDALQALVPAEALAQVKDLDLARVVAIERKRDLLLFALIEEWGSTPMNQRRWREAEAALINDVPKARNLPHYGHLHALASLRTSPWKQTILWLQRYRDRTGKSDAFIRQLELLQDMSIQHLLVDVRDEDSTRAALRLGGATVRFMTERQRNQAGFPATGYYNDTYLNLELLPKRR